MLLAMLPTILLSHFLRRRTYFLASFRSLLVAVLFASCQGQETPTPDASSSSYSLRFSDGPLAGKDLKASGLAEENAMALHSRQPGSNSDGVSILLNTEQVTVSAALLLTQNNQAQPLKPDETGSQIALTVRDGGSTYVYSGKSGPLSVKNYSHKSGSGAPGGLASLELEFTDAVFTDAVAAGNNEQVEVKLTGKISIK